MAIMKISVSGSHSTGKSTLVSFLASHLKARICPEAPMLIMNAVDDMKFFRRKNQTVTKQSLVQTIQILNEAHVFWKPESDVLICDRSVIDHAVYMRVLFPSWYWSAEGALYRDVVRKWIPTYRAIFKTPVLGAMTESTFREKDEDYRLEIDRAFYIVADEMKTELIALTGEEHDDLNIVKRYLQNG